MQKCDFCNRRGKLVIQDYYFGCKSCGVEPFVYRIYLCPYHLASTNRRNKWENFKKLTYVDFKPDQDVIDEAKAKAGRPA